jgi:RNA polymerase sigma-70 factor, ECF subfamily
MNVSPGGLVTFEAERARLRQIAYRVLGSAVDAEDVVQETWLRWDRLGEDGRLAVERPAAWLTTTASRIALDVLKSARRQREEYVGPWLPEPILTDADPATTVEMAESLTLGFLAVLERLTPVERTVFLLADVFGEPYASIAQVVERSEEACRQVASRARRRVREEHRRVTQPGAARRAELVEAFMAAVAFGQVDELRRILHDDVVLVSDGGREVHAARRPVLGVHRVTRLLLGTAKRLHPDTSIEVHEVNGEPGVVMLRSGVPWGVIVLEIDGDSVSGVRLVLAPAKLRALVPMNGAG